MWTNSKNYVIYKINFPNGKVYIGLTSNLKKRSNDHMTAARKGYRFLVCKAINKYKDSVTFEILCNGKTYEDLYELEKGFIKQYKSFDTQFGYNCTEGGEGCLGTNKGRSPPNKGLPSPLKGIPLSKDHCKKISEAAKGNTRRLGHTVTEETKQKIRDKNIGRVFAKDHKKKISEARKGKPSNNRQSIKATNLDTKEERIFDSVVIAGNELNITRTSISNMLNGRSKRAGRYKFERII